MPSNSKRSILLWLALFGAVVAGYSPSFFANFYTEDYQYLSYLAQLDLAEGLFRSFGHNELDMAHVRFYRPLTSASLALDLRAFGTNPAPYLLVNLGLHLLTAASLLMLLRALIGNRIGAALGTFVFAANPYSINAAGFIAARSNLLVGLWLIWTVLCHLRARRSRSRQLRWLAWFCAALSLCSYEAAVVVPGLVFALELLVVREGQRIGERMGSALKHTLPFVLLVLGYFGLRFWALGVFIGAYPSRAASVSEPLDQLLRIVRALVDLGAPWSLGLPQIDRAPATAIIGALAVVGLGVLMVRRRDLAPVALFGLTWALAAAVPLYQVPDLLPLSGRRWYPASVGVALVTATLLVGCGTSRRRRRLGRLALVLTALWAGAFWVELYRHAHLIRDRSREQEQVRRQILDRQVERDAGRPLFVVFREGFESKYVNEVFQILLAASLSPPFTDEPVPVYPINTVEGLTRAELSALPGDVMYVDADGRLRPGPPPETPPGDALSGLRLLPTLLRKRALPLKFIEDLWLPLSPPGHARLRMTFVTQAATIRVIVPPIQRLPFTDPKTGGDYELVRGTDSTALRDAVRPVVPDRPWPFFVYVEALDDAGRPVTRSAVERIEILRRD